MSKYINKTSEVYCFRYRIFKGLISVFSFDLMLIDKKQLVGSYRVYWKATDFAIRS